MIEYLFICFFILYRGIILHNSSYGWVYIVSNQAYPGLFKIGMTGRKDPYKRIKELNSASIPHNFVVHVFIRTKKYKQLEKELHREFKDDRYKKEYFRITKKQIINKLNTKGIEVDWYN